MLDTERTDGEENNEGDSFLQRRYTLCDISSHRLFNLWQDYARYLPSFVTEDILKPSHQRELVVYTPVQVPPGSPTAGRDGEQADGGGDEADGGGEQADGGMRDENPASSMMRRFQSDMTSIESLPSCCTLMGAVAILDVSGFTKLTSEYSQLGSLGADIVATFLNSYFSMLIKTISRYGGDVQKFAGDALIVLFRPDMEEEMLPDGGLKAATLRGAMCLHELVEAYGCVAVSRSGEPVKADAEPVPMEILTPDPSRDYTGAFEGFQDEDISYGKILERTNQGLNMLVKEFGKSNPLHIGSLPRTGKLLSLREFRTCVEERAENDDPGAIYSMLYRPMPSASSREAQISRSGSSIASTDSEYVAELERLYTKSLDDDVRSITGSKKKVFLKAMMSCGEIAMLRVGGRFKIGESGTDSMNIWEVIMVDGNSKASIFKDIFDMDGIIKSREVLLSSRAAALIQDEIKCTYLHDGIALLDGVKQFTLKLKIPVPRESVEIARLSAMGINDARLATRALEEHIPSMIQDSLKNGLHLVSDLRTCSIVFFGFPSLQADSSLNQVQKVFAFVQERISESIGGFLQMRFDEKGFVLICAFGLPGRSFGSLPSRALSMALKTVQGLHDLGHTAAVGVTTGYVLCTSVGSPQRAEYSIFGEMINLAARLMCLAKKSNIPIICDEKTYHVSRDSLSIEFQRLLPHAIKGFDGRFRLFSPSPPGHPGWLIPEHNPSVQRKPSQDEILAAQMLDAGLTKFIGMKEERARIADFVQDLSHNKSNVVLLYGVAGSGKTRIIEETLLHPQQKYSSTTFYSLAKFPNFEHGWGEMFRKMLNALSKSHDKAEKKHRPSDSMLESLCKFLEVSKTGSHVLALLDILDSIDISELEPSDSSRYQTPETYLFAKVMVEIWERFCALVGPVIIILDGMQFAHESAWLAIQNFLNSTRSRPILIVCSFRIFQFILRLVVQYDALDKAAHFRMLKQISSQVGRREDFISVSQVEDPLKEVASRLLAYFKISNHEKTVHLAMRIFTIEETREMLIHMFPGLLVSDQVAAMVHDAMAGHAASIREVCRFFYTMDSEYWKGLNSALDLGRSVVQYARTSVMMWTVTQAMVDTADPRTQVTFKLMSLSGRVFRADILAAAHALPVTEKDIIADLSCLEFLGLLERHTNADGSTWWELTPSIQLVFVLEMMTFEQRSEYRARLAMAVERLYADSELCYGQAAYFWSASARFQETKLWKRLSRAIAAFEDQARVELAKENFTLAIETLESGVRSSLALSNAAKEKETIVKVPGWRHASWERVLAACYCLLCLEKDSIKKKEYFVYFQQSLTSCLKALAILGAPLPLQREVDANLKPCRCSRHSRLALSMLGHLLKFRDPIFSLRSCCTLKARARSIIVHDDDDSVHEPIKEIRGVTIEWLPGKGKTESEEIADETTKCLQILVIILENAGVQDQETLEYVQHVIRCSLRRMPGWRNAMTLRHLLRRVGAISVAPATGVSLFDATLRARVVH